MNLSVSAKDKHRIHYVRQSSLLKFDVYIKTLKPIFFITHKYLTLDYTDTLVPIGDVRPNTDTDYFPTAMRTTVTWLVVSGHDVDNLISTHLLYFLQQLLMQVNSPLVTHVIQVSLTPVTLLSHTHESYIYITCNKERTV